MNEYELIWIDTWCPTSWIGLWRIGCRAVHHELNCELLLWIVYLKIWIKHFFVGSYWFMLIQVFQFLNHKLKKHDLIWINMNQFNSTWICMIWCELLWTNVNSNIILNQYEAVWIFMNVYEPIWISSSMNQQSLEFTRSVRCNTALYVKNIALIICSKRPNVRACNSQEGIPSNRFQSLNDSDIYALSGKRGCFKVDWITLESSDSVHEHLHASLWSKISEEVKWLLNLDKWDTESANVGSGMILPSTSCSMQWELNLNKKDWIALCVTDLKLKRSWDSVLKTSDALPQVRFPRHWIRRFHHHLTEMTNVLSKATFC